jgi:hypothetical protein
VFGNVFKTFSDTSPTLWQEQIPNVVRFACKAGTVCAIDTAVWCDPAHRRP